MSKLTSNFYRLIHLFCLLFWMVPFHPLIAQDVTTPLPPTIASPEPSESSDLTQALPSSGSHEFSNKLALRDNDLHADPPILGEISTTSNFTRELIRDKWRSGDPVDIYVVRPEGVHNPPVILYLYGYPAEASKFLNDDLCRKLTRDGFAAVGFEAPLTGQRYHDVPMKEWYVSELQHSLSINVHDVQMVLNYLASRGDLDMDRVGIFGQGSGGTVAILAAGVDPRIKAVDAIDPWGDWPDWLAQSPVVPDKERADYLKPDFLAEVAPLDPVRQLPKMDPRKFRLQQTLFSKANPELVGTQIAASVSPSTEVVRYTTLQDYTERAAQSEKILDWLHEKLKRK